MEGDAHDIEVNADGHSPLKVLVDDNIRGMEVEDVIVDRLGELDGLVDVLCIDSKGGDYVLNARG